MGLTERKIHELIDLITERASGVFLWASVVVDSVIRSYTNYDDFEELIQRIDMLPADLKDLYDDTWKRLNSDDKGLYKMKSALYFRLVMESEDHRVSQLGALVCAESKFAKKLLAGGPDSNSEEDILQECEKFEKQIHARSAGLLQVSRTSPPDNYMSEKVRRFRCLGEYFRGEISFLHRSAVHWLRESGQLILQHEQRSMQELQLRVQLGSIAELLFVRPEYFFDLRWYFLYPLLPLEKEIRSQIQPTYHAFVAEMMKRSPLGSPVTTELHLVEVAIWTGSFTSVRDFIESSQDQSHNAILGWLCCRLWDVAVGDITPIRHIKVTENDWIEVLRLISILLSRNCDLKPFHSVEGLRSLYNKFAIDQPAFGSFLIAFNRYLEKGWPMSLTLQSSFLSVMCEFLKYKEPSDFRMTVGIGVELRRGGATYGRGSCWSHFESSDPMYNNSRTFIRMEMRASEIFRYSRSRLLDLESFHSIPRDVQDVIKTFLDLQDGQWQARMFRIRINFPENGDDCNTEVWSNTVDSKTLQLGIQLAEAGDRQLFSICQTPEEYLPKTDAGQRLRELFLMNMESCKGSLNEQYSVIKGVFSDVVFCDRQIYPLTPNKVEKVDFSDIDWSEKPGYAALDAAITRAFSSESGAKKA